MRYYPVLLDLSGKPCVVVGGGSVAERKVMALLGSGAEVTVISPRLTKGLKELHRRGKVRSIGRSYRPGDLEGATIAVAATDSTGINRAVSREALKRKIPVNVVDAPELSSFIVPSVVSRGSLVISVSTSGKSPALSKKLREELEKVFTEEYGTFVEILGAVREKLLKKRLSRDKKERVFKVLVDSPMPRWIREKEAGEIDAFLKSLLGDGYTLKSLGIKL